MTGLVHFVEHLARVFAGPNDHRYIRDASARGLVIHAHDNRVGRHVILRIGGCGKARHSTKWRLSPGRCAGRLAGGTSLCFGRFDCGLPWRAFGQLLGRELFGRRGRGPESRHLMPQARAADTLTHLFLLTVRTDRLMHLDDCGLTPHAHVAQIGGGQVEQPGFVGQHRLLRGRQFQPFHRLVRVRLFAGGDQNLGDVRRVGRHRIRPVLLRVGQSDGRLFAQVLDVERLA